MTDTDPPGVKFEVLVVTRGDGHVSPAVPNVLATAATAWTWASLGLSWTTAAWTPARAADSTSPWAESTLGSQAKSAA